MATQIVMENAEGNILDIPSAGVERRGQIDITATNGFFRVERYDGSNNFTHDFLKSHSLTGSGALITGNAVSNALWTVVENAEKTGSLLRYICPEDGNEAVRKMKESNIQNGNYNVSSGFIATQYAEGVDNNYPQLNLFEEGPTETSIAGTQVKTVRFSGAYDPRINVKYGNTGKVKLYTNIYIEDNNYQGLVQDNGDWNQIFAIDRCVWLCRDKFIYLDNNGNWQHEAYPNNAVIPSQEYVPIEADLDKTTTDRRVSSVENLKIGDIDLSGRVFNRVDNGYDNVIHLRGNKYYGGDNAESILRYAPLIMFGYDDAVSLIGQDGADEYYSILKAYITPDNNA